MKQSEKVAIVRVFTDLIKSDTVIDMREIEFFQNICDSYNIDIADTLADAQKLSLADAVNKLDGLSHNERLDIVEKLERLSLADGKCEPCEALLLVALRSVLLHDETSGQIGTSVEILDNIQPFTVMYVENDYDNSTNLAIKSKFRDIENEFRLSGFEFVYIPSLVENLTKMNKVQLLSIIRHIAPSVSSGDAEKVYDKLCGMTTADFCRSLLYNKLGLKFIYDIEPSFLVKMGDSLVSYKPVHDYFKFMITSDDVMVDVRSFIDGYRRISKGQKLVIQQSGDEMHFVYSGFNKSIFDLLAFPGKAFESRVLVDVNRHRIFFEDINEELELSAFERTLYVFLLYADVMGKVIRRNDDSAARVARLNRVFNKIYNMIGKWDNEADKPFFGVNLSPSLSRIKKQVGRMDLLSNKHLYIPNTEEDILSLKVDVQKVFVLDSITGQKLLMKDSDTWQNL